MVYTEEKKAKISKYCYRMDKACGNRDIRKASEYFGHLKHHVMTGGATPQEIENSISEINGLIKNIEEGKKQFSQLNSQQQSEILSLKSQIEGKNKEIETKDTEINRLRSEMDALTASNQTEAAAKIQESEAKLKTERESLQNEKKKLEEELAEKTKIMMGYTLGYTKAENEEQLNIAINENGLTEEEKQYLRDIQNQVRQKIEQIKKLADDNATLTTQKGELNEALAQLQATEEMLKGQLKAAETATEKLKSEHDEYTNRLLTELGGIAIKLRQVEFVLPGESKSSSSSSNIPAAVETAAATELVDPTQSEEEIKQTNDNLAQMAKAAVTIKNKFRQAKENLAKKKAEAQAAEEQAQKEATEEEAKKLAEVEKQAKEELIKAKQDEIAMTQKLINELEKKINKINNDIKIYVGKSDKANEYNNALKNLPLKKTELNDTNKKLLALQSELSQLQTTP